MLGKGAFGKVYLTELRGTGKLFAVKTIRKDILLETSSIKSTELERDILLNVRSPFLVNMDYVF